MRAALPASAIAVAVNINAGRSGLICTSNRVSQGVSRV
jgi:hypothetical protein